MEWISQKNSILTFYLQFTLVWQWLIDNPPLAKKNYSSFAELINIAPSKYTFWYSTDGTETKHQAKMFNLVFFSTPKHTEDERASKVPNRGVFSKKRWASQSKVVSRNGKDLTFNISLLPPSRCNIHTLFSSWSFYAKVMSGDWTDFLFSYSCGDKAKVAIITQTTSCC